MRILAIESSCDESAAAYLEVTRGKIVRFAHIVATQAIHAKYGGVVPEVAAREHSTTMPLVLAGLGEQVMGTASGVALGRKVDVIAVTRGPGLITSLKVGVDTARGLAAAWNKKLVGVNHIDGHVRAAWLPGAPLEGALKNSRGIFPALVLVVSGGHTELLLMRDETRYRLLGATRDDAAGEAFDKSAKLLGLGYPGGPALSRLALGGDAKKYPFPRPMINDPHFDFSFSGLKTAVRYFLEKEHVQLQDPRFARDAAASIEQAIVDVLVAKTVRATKETRAKTVILAGGVAANTNLRRTLGAVLVEQLPKVRYAEPPLQYCTDNAAMIAMAGYFSAKRGKFDDWKKMEADPRWEVGRKHRE